MKVITILKYVFSFIGAGMLIGTLFLYQHTTTFLDGARETEGTVIALGRSRSSSSTTYYPVVTFNDARGQHIEFSSSSSSNPPAYSRGETVSVLYEVESPENARINDFMSLWGAVLILSILGGVFFLVGMGLFVVPALKNRKEAYLRKHGTIIETRFQNVEYNEGVSVNGRSPFQVITQWQNPDNAEIHLFRSNNLWYDPTNHINVDTIRVFIDRNNPRKYAVDLSFLPKVAG